MKVIEEIEIIDIFEYTDTGRIVPAGKKYRIKVDGQLFIVSSHLISGLDILILAGKNPPDRYRLYQLLRGQTKIIIEPNTIIDLTKPGIEKFVTLPLDQNDGGRA